MASWNAKGWLSPLWQNLPGKRDGLAALTGIRGPELSAYNSGKRNLGTANARRIATALGVSVLELGAPVEEADEKGETFLDLLADLRAVVEAQGVKTNEALDLLRGRVDALEARPGRSATKPRKAKTGKRPRWAPSLRQRPPSTET